MSFGIGDGMGIVGMGMGLYNAFRNKDGDDARQIRQQQKLTDMQAAANEAAAGRNYQRQLDFWNATNYEAQVKHMENAGLNKALMYGMGGGGGATTGSQAEAGVSGGQAATAAATEQNKLAMGMQLAQMGLMTAQAEKTKAETKNLEASTGKTTVETETAKGTQEAIINRTKTEAETAIEEMWLKTNERTWSDHTLKQRVEMTAQELLGQIASNKNTDMDTKKKQAEATIAEFDAKMTEEGISTRAPWYLKMITDLLEKVGLNPITKAKEVLK